MKVGQVKVVSTLTLVAGSATLTDPRISSDAFFFVSRRVTGGTVGHLSVSVSGSTLTVTSASGTETSTVDVAIVTTP